MNERIEEFAKDCKILGEKEFAGKVVGFNYKKFAELIVRECIDLASAEQRRYANISHIDMSESAVAVRQFRLLMKEHFGVEE